MPSISGFIYLPIFLISGVAIILTTPIGVALAHSLPIGLLKRIFGVFAVIIGVHMTGLFNILPKPVQSKAVEQPKIVEDKATPDESKTVTIQPVKPNQDEVSDAPIPVEKPQAISKKKKDTAESTKNKTTVDNKNIKPKAQVKTDQPKPKSEMKNATSTPETNKSPDYTPPKYEKSSE
jgi:outer membrane biosynthesis protein TonB